MESRVLVERTQGIAMVRLNRPEQLNALDLEMGDALVKATADVAADARVRVVVLTGSGRAFCAGGDLRFFEQWSGAKSGAFDALTRRLHRVIWDLRQMTKPVIAAVNGTTAGAGFSLAMACDLRIAAEAATFKQAYTAVGLVPDGAWTLVVGRHLGMARAAELALLDPPLTAAQALALGLVNRVVPTSEVETAAADWAARLAEGPQGAFGRVKELLNRALWGDLEAQLERERQAIMAAADTADFAEGLAAFLERRRPRFTGPPA